MSKGHDQYSVAGRKLQKMRIELSVASLEDFKGYIHSWYRYRHLIRKEGEWFTCNRGAVKRAREGKEGKFVVNFQRIRGELSNIGQPFHGLNESLCPRLVRIKYLRLLILRDQV
jgi:hypothetical protein